MQRGSPHFGQDSLPCTGEPPRGLPPPRKLVLARLLSRGAGVGGVTRGPTDADLAPKKDTLFSNTASYSCLINHNACRSSNAGQGFVFSSELLSTAWHFPLHSLGRLSFQGRALAPGYPEPHTQPPAVIRRLFLAAAPGMPTFVPKPRLFRVRPQSGPSYHGGCRICYLRDLRGGPKHHPWGAIGGPVHPPSPGGQPHQQETGQVCRPCTCCGPDSSLCPEPSLCPQSLLFLLPH